MKGGYEVRIGRQRAFCPFSQIDIVRTTDTAAHVGRVYTFRIIEYKEGGRNLVVSRRALLEEEQRASAAEVRRSIVAGAVLTGRVASVRDFGAFVDLGGGVQGLLHVSEMGWSRVVGCRRRSSTPGDEITVKVLRVDEDDAEDRARAEAADRRSVVDACRRPTRSARCAPAASRASRSSARSSSSSRASKGWRTPRRSRRPGGRADGPSRSPSGMTGGVRDPEHRSREEADRRRARAGGLVARRRSAPRRSEIVPGARITGKVERHEKFGVFVFLAPGRTGLMPMSETGVAREADVVKAFPVGSDVEVVVLEVDPTADGSASAARRWGRRRKLTSCAPTASAPTRHRRKASARWRISCGARSSRGSADRSRGTSRARHFHHDDTTNATVTSGLRDEAG